MTGHEKAKQLFRDEGLAFPLIPDKLASQLKEHGNWLFITRDIDISPYNLQHYVNEVDKTLVEDYALLSHSGHGVNSYALQYYLVYGSLRMFLHLGLGGAYMDAQKSAAQICDCFSLADKIVILAQSSVKLRSDDYLLVVGSDFYGSYWFPNGEKRRKESESSKHPSQVLTEVLHWLEK